VDFSILYNNSIRIRTKHASFVIDPFRSIPKVSADAVIVLGNKEDIDLSRVSDYRIVIEGGGEYEVNNVKISGIGVGNSFVYRIFADNFILVLGRISALSRIQDESLSSELALLNVDENLEVIVAKLEPKTVILYGEKKMEGAKELGRDHIKPVQKFSIAKDKLPTEMEVVVLG